ALEDYEPKIREAVGAEKFEDAVRYAAALRNPIDRFFDEVMVNVEDADIRRNRMRLLLRITGALEALADFAQIEDRK
ncbi:MAG: DALR anticodon-binding domain-containing protein, partial [Pseudomonadota bacterium]